MQQKSNRIESSPYVSRHGEENRDLGIQSSYWCADT